MLCFFIIRINIIVIIFKSIMTTIITIIVDVGTAAIIYVAVFCNFILNVWLMIWGGWVDINVSRYLVIFSKWF